MIQEEGVDMMVTSGHATEGDWQIGYSYKNGQFICMSSNLIGKSMDGALYPVTHNGSPKVLSAAGNCLIGHIKSPNCMALAWMHSVGCGPDDWVRCFNMVWVHGMGSTQLLH